MQKLSNYFNTLIKDPRKDMISSVVSLEEDLPSEKMKEQILELEGFAKSKLNPKIWRWNPVPIKEWLLGKEYCNLKITTEEEEGLRQAVYDDVTDFFEFKGNNPWNRKYKEAIFCEGIGSGKCEAPETPVLMFDGTIKTYADIKVNDLIMGPDSKPRRVLETHKVHDEAYEIVPVKGDKKIVKYNHILSLKRTNKGMINKHRDGIGKIDSLAGKIINISVEDYLQKTKNFKDLHKLWRVGVKFKEKKINIDPYFLGLWLGDGNNNIVSVTTIDKEIKDCIYKIAEAEGLYVTINQNKNKTCPNYIINGQRKKKNHLMDIFRGYNLIKNKHIPKDFKINSRENRLELLAGLIDSDGSLHNNYFEFSNKNKRLCEDVLFLARSLGLAAYIKERVTTCKGKSFKSFRIGISGSLAIVPTRLKRKQATPREQIKDVLVTGIKEINYVGKKELIGFGLDKDHLFVAGDFTVTHNSFKMSIMTTYFIHLLLCLDNPQKYLRQGKSSKIAIMNMSINANNAKKIIFSELSSMINDNEWFKSKPWELKDSRMPDPICQSELRFKGNLFVIPGSGQWRTAVGYNILVGIMDEAGSYRNTDNSDQAGEIYDALQRRIGGRFEDKGAVIIGGSPMYELDFIEKKIHEGESETSKVLARRRNLWDSKYPNWSGEYFYVDKTDRIILENPTEEQISKKDILKIPAIPFLFKDFRANVTKALRDFGAHPSASINSFFETPKTVIHRINTERTEDPVNHDGTLKDWVKPIMPNSYHCIHVDLALTGCACGFALGHFNGFDEEGAVQVYIDLMMRIEGSKESPIRIGKVRDYIYALTARGFNINLITYDGFQSVDSRQMLEGKGYNTEPLSVDRTMEAYADLKESINEDRVDYYCISPNNMPLEERLGLNNSELTASEVFVKEAMRLEEIEGKKVDHPPKGCTSADTAILYNDTIKEIGDISEESFEVVSYKDGKFIKTKAKNARITKYVNELIEVEFEDGSILKCTPEHPILLDNEEWIQAQSLKPNDNIKCLTKV